jgi:hypothetical protein
MIKSNIKIGKIKNLAFARFFIFIYTFYKFSVKGVGNASMILSPALSRGI